VVSKELSGKPSDKASRTDRVHKLALSTRKGRDRDLGELKREREEGINQGEKMKIQPKKKVLKTERTGQTSHSGFEK